MLLLFVYFSDISSSFSVLLYIHRYALLFLFILTMQYSALIRSHGHRAKLIDLINQKEVVGDLFNQLRLALQRKSKGRPAQVIFPTHMNVHSSGFSCYLVYSSLVSDIV